MILVIVMLSTDFDLLLGLAFYYLKPLRKKF